MTAHARPNRVAVGDAVIRVYDRGPEPDWHTDRSLFGPWWRFEAELTGDEQAIEHGMSPWEAVYRLIANHRDELNGLTGGS